MPRNCIRIPSPYFFRFPYAHEEYTCNVVVECSITYSERRCRRMQAPNEHNPEFEMYRQVLMRERRTERIQGWVLTILGAVSTVPIIAIFIWSFQRTPTYGLFSTFMLLMFALGFIATFSLGLSSLRRASKLPTVH